MIVEELRRWLDSERNRRAEAHFKAGNHQKAVETLLLVMEKYHATKYDHMNLGTISLHLNQIDQTVKHFKEALALDPDLAYAKKMLVELKAHHRL